MQERPRSGWPRSRGRAAFTRIAAALSRRFKMQKANLRHPAFRQPKFRNLKACTHHRTNHLFNEGKKDVAGKSNDSCTQAKVDRQDRSARQRIWELRSRAVQSRSADARAGAQCVL